jgi:phosphodiesterase/alkaline phosphatase D-like protein
MRANFGCHADATGEGGGIAKISASWRGLLAATLALALACVGAVDAQAQGTGAHTISLRANPLVADGAGLAPEVETEAASEVKRESAILRATVNPESAAITECTFEWGTTPSEKNMIACADLPEGGENGIPVYAVLEGLSEHATYYFKIYAKSAFGEGHGRQEKFTTLPDAPKVNTEPASAIEHHTAVLNGVVDPNGGEVTSCLFEWGTTERYGQTAACDSLPGSGEKGVAVAAKLEGLAEHTDYYYRLVAGNSLGARYGNQERFSTLPTSPEARTEGATAVTKTAALLEGSVNPRGSAIKECFFEYGTSRSYGKEVACGSAPGAGEKYVAVSAPVSGLAEHQAYDFELVVTNESGEALGGNQAFSTFPAAPRDDTTKANEITDDSAILHGTVNPDDGNVNTCEFEYGPNEHYTKSVACETLPGDGESPVSVKASVASLEGNTLYFFRVHAANAYGEAYGGQSRFTTAEAGLAPVVTKVTPSKGLSNGGTSVTIRGANFTGVTGVMFGSDAARDVKFIAVGEVTAVSPPGTTGSPVNITVMTPNGTSAITTKDDFSYGRPTISGYSPTSGPIAGDTKVTIDGSGFSTASGKTTFEFGTALGTSVECNSSTTCTVYSPPASKAGGVKLAVTVDAKRAKTKHGEFTYTS